MSYAPRETFGMPRSVIDPKASRGRIGRPADRAASERERAGGGPTATHRAVDDISLERIVGLPVLASDGERVGTVADVVVNESLTTVLGVDLTTTDERRTRFLPWFLLRAGACELTLLSKAELGQRSTIGLILGRGRRLSSGPSGCGAGVVDVSGDIRVL